MKHKLISLGSLALLCPSVLALTSCSNNTIVIANFESYMSTDLIDAVEKKFHDQAQFLYYGTNEDIDRKFDRNYDVATPSSYQAINMIKRGSIHRIDWSVFDLYKPDQEHITKNKINNGHDALKLFTKPIQIIIEEQSKDIFQPDANGYIPNLLDYCIPYFLQSWIFAYKGDKIKDLEQNSTWVQTIDKISNKSATGDKRFKNTKLACIDDVRSLYGISHLIENERNAIPAEDWTVNPSENDNRYQYEITYKNLKDSFLKNSFWLNSDSGSVLNSFADPNGDIGAFAYNGDILYACQGADTYDVDYNNDNVHVITPNQNLLAIDMMVINAKANGEHLNKIYEMLKFMLLDGVDSTNEITERDKNGSYVKGPMCNFESVQYTDVFKTINDYVNKKDNDSRPAQDSYFGLMFDWEKEEGETDEAYNKRINNQYAKINLWLSIYNVPDMSSYINFIEKPINGHQKSDMYGAYVKTIKNGL
ncbi:putative spermidine/putrescine-binding periplasmic transport protein [Candidatus Malacoplasma girerdii]|uniref:Spermidine/putrescine-binding periplasmic transport protein n=1 Tax=Candidatus Malacoplasma girerdii TaxID=1318617 RepID=A0A097SSH6_9BACT|nr:putative spermidine/putrescine-binding periplasmic transport protein [Candidatus Malacoplasma girerdii]